MLLNVSQQGSTCTALRKYLNPSISSVTQLCLTLCDPRDYSTPSFPVHHQLPEFTQTHVHRVGDAIQPSHPLSSPSPLAFNLSQHQSLFQWVSSLYQVAKVLEFQLQHQTFQWIFPLGRTGWISLQSKRLSRVFSNTTVQKKWALGSITMSKASGDDGIPVEQFQILKDDALKCCTQYASKFGKLSSGTGLEKVSFHSKPKERQCQRMFKLPHNCSHLTP